MRTRVECRPGFLFLALALAACLVIITPTGIDAQDGEKALGGEERIGDGFRGQVYFLPDGTNKLPDFSTLEPVGVIYTDILNVAPRQFDKGFPGVTDRFEWFAIEYKTTFHANSPGDYKFRINSDDGTKLFIDGQLVIDNDGVHPPQAKEGKIALTGGEHEMVVQYFQGPRHRIPLQLFYAKGEEAEAVFPGKDFSLSTPGGTTWWWWLAAIACLVLFFIVFYVRRRQRKQEPDD
jgi:hypothetical protein